jgi:RecJ-like exonuclease
MWYQWEIINKENNRSLVISGSSTLDAAKTESMKSANYYITEPECRYQVTIEITEQCDECNNYGYVTVHNNRNKFIGKKVKCKTCKGKCPSGKWVIEMEEITGILQQEYYKLLNIGGL